MELRYDSKASSERKGEEEHKRVVHICEKKNANECYTSVRRRIQTSSAHLWEEEHKRVAHICGKKNTNEWYTSVRRRTQTSGTHLWEEECKRVYYICEIVRLWYSDLLHDISSQTSKTHKQEKKELVQMMQELSLKLGRSTCIELWLIHTLIYTLIHSWLHCLSFEEYPKHLVTCHLVRITCYIPIWWCACGRDRSLLLLPTKTSKGWRVARGSQIYVSNHLFSHRQQTASWRSCWSSQFSSFSIFNRQGMGERRERCGG